MPEHFDVRWTEVDGRIVVDFEDLCRVLPLTGHAGRKVAAALWDAYGKSKGRERQ